MSTSFHTLLDRIGRTSTTLRLASARGDHFYSFPVKFDEIESTIDGINAAGQSLWFEINESSFNEPEGRSKKQHATRLNALYVDIDYKGGGMGSEEAAWQVLDDLSAALGAPPAAVVHTGGGLQPYWPISDGKIDDESRETIAIVLARWKEMCRTFARAAGGAVDSVFDLPRIFRVPGTYNVKPEHAEPPLVTVDLPEDFDTFTLEELQGIFDDYGIEAVPREIPTGVTSAMSEWEWADEDCKHVHRIREEWGSKIPGARHQWLLAQAAVLHGMIRYGCLTEETFESMRIELDQRFQILLASDENPRPPGAGEVAAAYRWGAEQASLWSKEKLIDEMRQHIHDSFLEQLVRGATTLAQGPIGQAPAAPQPPPSDNVIGLFTRKPIGGGSASVDTTTIFGNLALVDPSSHSRLAAVAHTDTGNAELFAQEIAGRFAYVSGTGWYMWNGQRWAPDRQNLHREAYKDLFTQRVIASNNPQETQWLNNSLNIARVNAAIKLAESTEAARMDPYTMDSNMRELVTPSGVIDLMTGILRPTNPLVDRHTKLTRVAPDFSGPPVQFIRFMLWAFHGNVEMVAYMQRLLGLALIGELRVQIFPMLLGSGANGKSTLFDILMAILGDYVLKMPPSFLVLQKGSQIPEALASLKGVRVAFASEVPAKASFDEELVKSITGDATLNARRLYENSAEFLNTTTLFGAFNHAPSVPVGGPSWWRRARLIRMTAFVPDDKQDLMLRQRIVDEEGGKVLAWLLQGTLNFLEHGELQPQAVRDATSEYRASEDDLARFVDTELLPADGVVLRQSVYQRYVAFMQTNRLYTSMVSEPKFVREFLVIHPGSRVINDGVEDVSVFGGFSLKGGGYALPEFPFEQRR